MYSGDEIYDDNVTSGQLAQRDPEFAVCDICGHEFELGEGCLNCDEVDGADFDDNDYLPDNGRWFAS